MYKKFIQALTWNSINIFAYKTILISHQIILFYFLPTTTYGTSGSIFALIYFMIGITGFGFEYTLYTFFSHHKQNKQHFKQLLPQYFVRIATIISVAIALYFIFTTNINSNLIKFWTESIPLTLLPYLLLIFISESIKRSLETLAQLLFLNKQIATIQISMIFSYVLLFWSSYAITGHIDLHTIFIPMTCISYTEIILLTTLLYKFYKTLPQAHNTNNLQNSSILKDQLYNYINQLGKSFFSPNFLMTFIAYNLGMAQAGRIRFFTNIITLLYMLLNRSVGIPSGALLSNMTQQAFEKTKQAFLEITNMYIQFLYALCFTIIVIIAPRLLTIASTDSESYITYHILFFMFAGFVEYLTLTYEKLYITQRASWYLALVNITSMVFLFITIQQSFITHQKFLLLPMCLIRIVTSIIISAYAYKKWSIKPSISINRQTMLVTTISIITIKACMYLYQKIHI